MIDTKTVLDSGMVYFDALLAQRNPTVEIRVADVCLHTQDAVLLAALVRGLVETAAREWTAGVAARPVRVELLKPAAWQAARFGLGGELLDPRTLPPTPADAVMKQTTRPRQGRSRGRRRVPRRGADAESAARTGQRCTSATSHALPDRIPDRRRRRCRSQDPGRLDTPAASVLGGCARARRDRR